MEVALLSAAWGSVLVEYATDFGIASIMVGMVLCLDRLVRGPHLADRALALDTIAVHLIGLVILFTIRLDSLVLFDGVLVLSLLGFAGTVAVAQYIMRPHHASRRARQRAPIEESDQ